MKKTCLTLSLLLLLTGFITAQNITMKIEGIAGESVSAKFRDKTELLAFLLEGSSPQTTTGGSGMSVGKRTYKPVVLLKLAGSASPLLFQHFFMGKMIKDVVIEFYKQDKTGAVAVDYVVTLRNVNISNFKQFAGPVKNDKFNITGTALLYDEMELNFREIVVEYKSSGVIVQDNLMR